MKIKDLFENCTDFVSDTNEISSLVTLQFLLHKLLRKPFVIVDDLKIGNGIIDAPVSEISTVVNKTYARYKDIIDANVSHMKDISVWDHKQNCLNLIGRIIVA